jgi:hypothetical protein
MDLPSSWRRRAIALTFWREGDLERRAGGRSKAQRPELVNDAAEVGRQARGLRRPKLLPCT